MDNQLRLNESYCQISFDGPIPHPKESYQCERVCH